MHWSKNELFKAQALPEVSVWPDKLQIVQLNSSSGWDAQTLEVCAAPSTKGQFIPS